MEVFADRSMVLPQANVGCRGRGALGFVVSGSDPARRVLKNGMGSPFVRVGQISDGWAERKLSACRFFGVEKDRTEGRQVC